MPDPTFQARFHRVMSFGTAVFALLALGVALAFAPARSGPNCIEDCITWPYTDAAAFVPRDFWWMIFAFLLALTVPLLFVSASARVRPGREAALQAAVVLATIAAAILTFTYGTQYLTVQVSLARSETTYLSLWSQYNPHGMFVMLESVGFFITALALLNYGLALHRVDRRTRIVAGLCRYGGVLAAGLLPLTLALYRFELEYRYEVLAIAILWPLLTVVGAMSALRDRERSFRDQTEMNSPRNIS